MERQNTRNLAKPAKTHSRTRAEEYVKLGWKIDVEIKAENGETCEWVLNWPHDTDPVKPS